MGAPANGAGSHDEAMQQERERLRRLRAVADRQRREAEIARKDAFLSRVTHRS